jgi:transcriptional regulator with XRE-family HTH domain
MNNDLKQIGFNIRAARENKQMNREDLAALVEIHPKTLQKWENGQSDPPTTKVILLSKVLEISVPQLLGAEPMSAKDSFNNNQQGEQCVLTNSGTITFCRSDVDEMNKRSTSLERIIFKLQEENQRLLTMLERPSELNIPERNIQ